MQKTLAKRRGSRRYRYDYIPLLSRKHRLRCLTEERAGEVKELKAWAILHDPDIISGQTVVFPQKAG
jgi:hypothetical protein